MRDDRLAELVGRLLGRELTVCNFREYFAPL
jgi:hypothetical protein